LNWAPFSIALSIFFATFISEDAAFLTSLALVAEGVLPSWLGIGASAAGIWVGDAGLFFMGRLAAETPFAKSKIRNWEGRARASRYFGSGGKMIFIARFIPGARLPVYFGSGLLRVPTSRFLGITAVGVAVWMTVGSLLIEVWKRSGLPKSAGILLFVAGFALLVFVPRIRQWSKEPAAFRVLIYRTLRLRHFEFWPMFLFYPPVIFYYLGLAIRYRNIKLPLYANPAIPNAGIVGESKSGILRDLSARDPAALASIVVERPVLSAEAAVETALDFMRNAQIEFPVILKPDVGQRGSGVRLVAHAVELGEYLSTAKFRVVLQAYCPWSEEIGLNYVRFPGATQGEILGITRKRFPSIVGDGRSTVADLILADPRARLIAKTYFSRHRERLGEVLPSGESLRLVESGNHCQGTIFERGEADLVTPALLDSIERVAWQIPDFHVGRFDLRFESERELRAGRFKVIELNGAAGEATWIYDRRVSLVEAYATLFSQIRTLYRIGDAVRKRGEAPRTTLIRDWLRYRRDSKSHPATT
jgi:membrane protein DedA with SNARE-associated domain